MCYALSTYWIPAFAGMTMLQLIRASLNENSVYVPDDARMVKNLSHAAAEIFQDSGCRNTETYT